MKSKKSKTIKKAKSILNTEDDSTMSRCAAKLLSIIDDRAKAENHDVIDSINRLIQSKIRVDIAVWKYVIEVLLNIIEQNKKP